MTFDMLNSMIKGGLSVRRQPFLPVRVVCRASQPLLNRSGARATPHLLKERPQ